MRWPGEPICRCADRRSRAHADVRRRAGVYAGVPALQAGSDRSLLLDASSGHDDGGYTGEQADPPFRGRIFPIGVRE
jgi:hypothetical protein